MGSRLKNTCEDEDFFANYAGSGKSYDRVWRHYSYAEELVTLWRAHPLPPVRRIMVLGAATGRILPVLEKGFPGAKCGGCELNAWAHARIPAPFRRRIRRADMRDYVRALAPGARFDLAFSNSLIYLPKREVPRFLGDLAPHVRMIHFESSFRGSACPDPYRQTLESLEWWNCRFARAGYRPVRLKGVRRTYLWETGGAADQATKTQ